MQSTTDQTPSSLPSGSERPSPFPESTGSLSYSKLCRIACDAASDFAFGGSPGFSEVGLERYDAQSEMARYFLIRVLANMRCHDKAAAEFVAARLDFVNLLGGEE